MKLMVKYTSEFAKKDMLSCTLSVSQEVKQLVGHLEEIDHLLKRIEKVDPKTCELINAYSKIDSYDASVLAEMTNRLSIELRSFSTKLRNLSDFFGETIDKLNSLAWGIEETAKRYTCSTELRDDGFNSGLFK